MADGEVAVKEGHHEDQAGQRLEAELQREVERLVRIDAVLLAEELLHLNNN